MEEPKILIVDDSRMDRENLVKFYRRSFINSSICCAETYQSAKEIIKQEKFDIISLDGDLPDFKKGYHLIPSIKKHQYPNCKIIMISDVQNNIIHGKSLGAHRGFLKIYIEANGDKTLKLNKNLELIPFRETRVV